MTMAATTTPTTPSNFRGAALEKLDGEFNDLLDKMKAYVLNLTRKSERQRIAMWIKKLCEPPGSLLSSRKNRNMYGQVLLAMLKRDLIEEPFSQQPEPGLLPTMPPYMSIYVDSSTAQRDSNQQEELADTPSWLKGELDKNIDPDSGDFPVDKVYSKRLSSTRRNAHTNYRDEEVNGPLTSTGIKHGAIDKNSPQSPYQARRASGGKVRYEPIYLREILNNDSSQTSMSKSNDDYASYLSQSKGSASFKVEQEEQLIKRIHGDREVEVRTKLAEAKYHEDKLKLQQQHDLSVQKILDRKNCELEEVKSRSRAKMAELEARVKKQDKRVVQQAKELEVLKEQRDKQVLEMKNMAQEKGTTLQNNFEKKLHDKIAEYEQEKFEMQKKHTADIQDIMAETTKKVEKMEAENNEQVTSLNNGLHSLQNELATLSEECEILQLSKIQLEQQKIELQSELVATKTERNELQDSLGKSESEIEKLVKTQAADLGQMKQEAMEGIAVVEKEKDQIVTKLSGTITALKKEVSEVQQAMEETKFEKQQELHELTTSHRQEKINLQQEYEHKLHNVEDELRKLTVESSGKISDLETALSEKSAEIERCVESGRVKSEEAERALGEFKQQMEENATKLYESTREQMGKVEKDLEKSRVAREKQNKEFTKQIENEQNRHEKLVAELKISFEQEKTFLIREHQKERETLTKEHEKEREIYSEKYRSKLQDAETLSRNKSSRDAKVILELQQANCDLREELLHKESLYKQQLVELGMLREEEKQTFKRQEEAQASRNKSQSEQQRLELQRKHSLEMEQLLEKTNSRFKQMEQEYNERSKKTQETMDALRDEIRTLKHERVNFQNSQEKRFNICTRKHEDEKTAMKNHHVTVVQSLEKDLEGHKATMKEMEKQLRETKASLEAKISKLRLNYEEKMKGLLPANIKKELEDTIQSLRQQVSFLQSRANVLQEELDATNTLSSTWDMSRFEHTNHNS